MASSEQKSLQRLVADGSPESPSDHTDEFRRRTAAAAQGHRVTDAPHTTTPESTMDGSIQTFFTRQFPQDASRGFDRGDAGEYTQTKEKIEPRTVDEFRELKKIRGLTPEQIKEKKTQFDSRYRCGPVTVEDGKLVVEVFGKRGNEPYYRNAIDLTKPGVEGWNNYANLDEYENGKNGRMNLSDIKYFTLCNVLDEVEKSDKPSLAAFRGQSIETFRPDMLGGGDIEESESRRQVLETIESYKEKKRNSGEALTPDEEAGRYFFSRGTPEFEKLMLNKIGKEKIFFVGHYYPDLDFTGLSVTPGNRSKYIESMLFPLEEKN